MPTKTPVKQIAMVAHREEGRFDTEQELDIVGAPVGTAERQITFSMGRFVGGVMAYDWGCAIVLDGRKGPTRIRVAMGETFELVMPDGRTAGRYCFTPRMGDRYPMLKGMDGAGRARVARYAKNEAARQAKYGNPEMY